MKANRGWVCTGSRYAGKKMCARRTFWEKKETIKVWISETKMVSQCNEIPCSCSVGIIIKGYATL
jgi:hypothetical protein